MSLNVELVTLVADKLLRVYGFEGFSKLLKQEPNIDERLSKLAKIQEDLREAMTAVDDLQKSAFTAKKEAHALEIEVSRLREDRALAAHLAEVPQEAFSRLLAHASAKGRGRGLLEGIAVGLFTGSISSYFIWYVTA